MNIAFPLLITNKSFGGIQLGMSPDDVMSIIDEPLNHYDSDPPYPIILNYGSVDFWIDRESKPLEAFHVKRPKESPETFSDSRFQEIDWPITWGEEKEKVIQNMESMGLVQAKFVYPSIFFENGVVATFDEEDRLHSIYCCVGNFTSEIL